MSLQKFAPSLQKWIKINSEYYPSPTNFSQVQPLKKNSKKIKENGFSLAFPGSLPLSQHLRISFTFHHRYIQLSRVGNLAEVKNCWKSTKKQEPCTAETESRVIPENWKKKNVDWTLQRGNENEIKYIKKQNKRVREPKKYCTVVAIVVSKRTQVILTVASNEKK